MLHFSNFPHISAIFSLQNYAEFTTQTHEKKLDSMAYCVFCIISVLRHICIAHSHLHTLFQVLIMSEWAHTVSQPLPRPLPASASSAVSSLPIQEGSLQLYLLCELWTEWEAFSHLWIAIPEHAFDWKFRTNPFSPALLLQCTLIAMNERLKFVGLR